MSGPEDRAGWQRLHPVTPLLRSIQLVYAFVLGGLAARFGGPTVAVVLATVGAVAAWITIGYLRFRYRITDDSLIIQRGVLFRERRVIPRTRIQNIDLRAGLVQQLLGVVTARVETAGGQGTEAVLHVVARAEGERLRDTLVALPARETPATAAGVSAAASRERPGRPAEAMRPETAVHRASLLDLVIAGATSNRAGVLVAALFGGDYFLDFMPTDWLLRRFLPPQLIEPRAAVETLAQSAREDLRVFLVGLLVLALLFGLAGWGISVLAAVARYFNFTLHQSGEELRVAYGLLTRREKGFRRSRVQNVQIEEPILRRWLGLASLRVQTAGYGPGVKADERVETLTPIAHRSEIPAYLRAVFPDLAWESVDWRSSHPRALRRLFVRRALLVVVVTLLAAIIFDPRAAILLTALLPAWFLAAAHFRQIGHARSGPYALVREGFWNRRTYIVPIRRIQALHLRQSPFQRRLGLGTVVVETAGSPYERHPPRYVDLGAAPAAALLQRLGTDVTATGLTF
jgi:putative membrane protein